jgi:hypothetical protein
MYPDLSNYLLLFSPQGLVLVLLGFFIGCAVTTAIMSLEKKH